MKRTPAETGRLVILLRLWAPSGHIWDINSLRLQINTTNNSLDISSHLWLSLVKFSRQQRKTRKYGILHFLEFFMLTETMNHMNYLTNWAVSPNTKVYMTIDSMGHWSTFHVHVTSFIDHQDLLFLVIYRCYNHKKLQ